MKDYRARIYQRYTEAREAALAPESVAGLKPREPWFNRLICDHLPKEKSSDIFELGCGHGAFLYFAERAGYTNSRGVDGSPVQIAAGKRLGIRGLTEGDGLRALQSMKDSSLDVVLAVDVIEHFTKEELLLVADEVSRVLRPEGRWIIHAPNGEGLFGPRMRYWDFTHEQAFTRNSMHQLLKACGFRQVQCFESAPVPHGPISFIRFVLWKCIRSALLVFSTIETGSFDRSSVFTQNLLVVGYR